MDVTGGDAGMRCRTTGAQKEGECGGGGVVSVDDGCGCVWWMKSTEEVSGESRVELITAGDL